MYDVKEIFKEEGIELKDVLKQCIYNYYLKYKKQTRKDKENVS